MVAYYPFSTTDTFNDYSVSQYNGMAYSTTTLSQGVFGQALYFPYNTSYFQARCFPSTDTLYSTFSFSIWVYPTILGSGGSIIHLSSGYYGNGTNCFDPLVLSSTGELIAQWMMQTTYAVSNVRGPVLSINKWTHIALVLSNSNGLRLFINGQLYITSSNAGNINLLGYTAPHYILLGNNNPYGPSGTVNCLSGTIAVMSGPFIGGVDEFRIYNRELSAQEICVLSNN